MAPAIAQTEVRKTIVSRPPSGTSDVSKNRATGKTGSGSDDFAPTLATAAGVQTMAGRTVFRLSTSRPISPQIFVLSAPERIIIDVPDLEFDLAEGAGTSGAGLVSAFRYGLVAAGRSRIVLDAAKPVKITRSGMTSASAGKSQHFEVEIETAEASWAPTTLPAPAAVTKAPSSEKRASAKFVIMIDPGHGGIDGGAVSPGQIVEKNITLSVGKLLQQALQTRGRYDVRMTRASDTFISLDARVELSQAAHADLFISLHADSVVDANTARTAQGASIYTLSETASNSEAQRFAEKENSADKAGGLSQGAAEDTLQVNSILADLMKRETHNYSLLFKGMLADRLRPANMLAREPSREAAFRVLRQLQTPTVLIELGYLTNQNDVAHLQDADWQQQMVRAIANAVDAFATRRQQATR